MNFNEIKEIIKVIDSTDLRYVKLENSDIKLEVSKDKIDFINNKEEVRVLENKENEISNISEIEDNSKSNDYKDDEKSDSNDYSSSENTEGDIYEVTAPIMGTFYSSPSPEDDPFVKKGSKISKGDTLCIIEAMKLMNEVKSEIDGEVVEVMVENESLVEYNQVLFRIRESI